MSLFPPPWEEPGYSDIEGAERRGHRLRVRFANGDVVEVDPERIGVEGVFELVEDADVPSAVVVSTADGRQEIDWMVVRAATDAGFARVLRERDVEESRRIARRLRALRVNAGISQKDAAEAAGMAPQQLANIERGSSDMRLSTVRTLLRALGASFADIAGDDAPEVPTKELASKLGIPRQIVNAIAAAVGHRSAPRALERIFGPIADALRTGREVEIAGIGPVRFKTGASAGAEDAALVKVAQFISERIAAEATLPEVAQVPRDPARLRAELVEHYGGVTLDALLAWCWSAGLIVLPVTLGPGFDAAVWLTAERPVIVLNQRRRAAVFWLFDLAHELGHIALGHVRGAGLVDGDLEHPDPDDPEEQAATAWALDLLVPDHEALIADVRERLRGKNEPEHWKWDVKHVAERAGYSPGVLGVVAAFAMTDVARHRDRWGSATNLARPEGEGHEKTTRTFREHVDLGALPEPDAALVRAFTSA